MQHQPKPQDQARILKAALKEMNLGIKHQDALGLVARMMGFTDVHTMSAAFNKSEEARQRKAKVLTTVFGPANGDVYEGIVTVDQTFSAEIRVRAHSVKEAKELLSEAGHAQWPHGFDLDDGNYRGVSDFYLGDSERVSNISEPDYDQTGDFHGTASWRDEQFEYNIDLSRNEPDNRSNEDRWAKCTVTLTVSQGAVSVEKVYRNWESHNDEPAEALEEDMDAGLFTEDLEKLVEKLKRKLKLK